jgi:hypothetical protein
LVRIVAMLTRMAMKFDGVSESPSEYNQSGDYEHEHRPVGLSTSTKEQPEQNHAPKWPVGGA